MLKDKLKHLKHFKSLLEQKTDLNWTLFSLTENSSQELYKIKGL